MTVALVIEEAGPGVTLQDGGRHGLMRFGVTPAGPMDALAFETANRALGGPAARTAIEVSLGGIVVTARGGALPLAVAGGDFAIRLDGRPLPPAAVLTLEPGMRLSIRAGRAGMWAYLAVGGRFDVAPVMGSTATHLRSGLGGLGRALRAGDVLAVLDPGPAQEEARLDAPWLTEGGPVRVMLGPQDDYFPAAEIERFLGAEWTVGPASDRMAYALEGPLLAHSEGFNIVSDGIAHGAIQVPGSGQPFVLMADRQPTGGYPKIATVIGADLGRMAQARPRDAVRFERVTHHQAVAARRRQAQALQGGADAVPLVRKSFPSDFLLGLNLVSGVVDGRS